VAFLLTIIEASVYDVSAASLVNSKKPAGLAGGLSGRAEQIQWAHRIQGAWMGLWLRVVGTTHAVGDTILRSDPVGVARLLQTGRSNPARWLPSVAA
jgi:hypothetical protein